jgi:hypothetical protein
MIQDRNKIQAEHCLACEGYLLTIDDVVDGNWKKQSPSTIQCTDGVLEAI